MQDLPTFFQSFSINQCSLCLILSPEAGLYRFSSSPVVGPGYYLDINYLFPGYSPFVSTTSSISSPILPFHFLRETLELWYFRLNVLTYSHLQRKSKVSKFQSLICFLLFNSDIASFLLFSDHFGLFLTTKSKITGYIRSIYRVWYDTILDRNNPVIETISATHKKAVNRF